jgi:acyl-CoA thioester hydrolase
MISAEAHVTAKQSRIQQIHDTQVRVRYAETDQMGVVYHANYAIWFEVGRIETLRQLGFAYKEMEAEGCRLAVVELCCRYRMPARYDDLIAIRTRVQLVRQGLIRFAYEVLRAEDGQLLAGGETVHMPLDKNGKRSRVPDKYLKVLRKAFSE